MDCLFIKLWMFRKIHNFDIFFLTHESGKRRNWGIIVITGTDRVKRGMAQMQKGGVIMDVVNAEQARIAEEAGAVAVMALERVPSDIRAAGGVARMADLSIVEEVMNAVSIPVMAKARIGHIVEARVLESLGLTILMKVKF